MRDLSRDAVPSFVLDYTRSAATTMVCAPDLDFGELWAQSEVAMKEYLGREIPLAHNELDGSLARAWRIPTKPSMRGLGASTRS